MSHVFADAYFWIALILEGDEAHAKALEFAGRVQGQLVTSEWVLMETADAIATSRVRSKIKPILDGVRVQLGPRLVEASSETFQRALDLYHRRPDKSWTLTDCTSFEIMRTRGITDALTADRHFEQAGFVALMK